MKYGRAHDNKLLSAIAGRYLHMEILGVESELGRIVEIVNDAIADDVMLRTDLHIMMMI